MPVLKSEDLLIDRINAIQNYHEAYGIARAEIDVSGGIDSAVMLNLLARALGEKNVTAVYSSINSSKKSLELARAAADSVNVKLIELELTDALKVVLRECYRGLEKAGLDLEEAMGRVEEDDRIIGSLRSCLRAPVGRFLNRLTGGGIRHGTGNECEDRWLRFYQKGGDGEVDTNPLAMLSKGEVYQLAWIAGVPSTIIEATPTPDLWGAGEDHNDEAELKALTGIDWTYSRVDPQTGEYRYVGTIERMSRFLDYWRQTMRESLFSSSDLTNTFFEGSFALQQLNTFGLGFDHVIDAQRWEVVTRHKENPNCPSLGDRASLVREGIITNNLPGVPYEF